MKLRFSGRQIIGTVIGLAIVGVVGWFFWGKREAAAEEYLTAKLERGDLRNSVFATGTLQAVTTVQVGSQVSGTIASLSADFNTKVRKGQVVAQLDPSILQAQVASQRANLEQARASAADAQAKLLAAKANVQNLQAGVSSARANLAALKAQLDDAASNLKRQQALAEAGIAAERDLETAKTAFNAADARYKQASAQLEQARSSEESSSTAGLSVAEAQIKQTQAQIRQAEASLRLAEVNLSNTTIKSPIDGVVVSRNVDVGQTVAASLSAPTLFTIANDLTQMQVIANIDQADIGAINQENKVSFTVDAYTGRRFEGSIKEIRLSPQNVQNVVTYNVVINVQNPDLKLLPGMTSNLTFAVAERKGVIKVPNAALRFTPKDMTPEKIREILRSQRGGQGQEGQAQSTAQPAAKPAENQQGAQSNQTEAGSRPGRSGQQGQQNDQAQAQQGQSGDSGGRARGGASGGTPIESQWRLVWMLGSDKKPQPRRVKLGITDGTATEILDGNLQEGESIIVGLKVSGSTATTTGTRAPGFGGAPLGGAGGGRR